MQPLESLVILVSFLSQSLKVLNSASGVKWRNSQSYSHDFSYPS